MNARKVVLALLAASMLTTGFSALAQPGISAEIEIGTPPPGLRNEYLPDGRPGYVWISGYWGWSGHRHVWVEGHWIPARRGYVYEPAHWDPVDQHWRLSPGHWVREVVVRRPGRSEVIREQERREERREEERHEERRDHRDHDRDDR